MIKDLTKIRELLKDYVEVEMPYDFDKGCSIQYVTCGLDSEGNIGLRFPRCMKLRPDKSAAESDTLDTVKEMM